MTTPDAQESRQSLWPYEDPRHTLKRHGFAPKRSFSQNFLISSDVVERIAKALLIEEEDRVIELGPGTGALTRALLRRSKHLTLIERDRDMLEVLQKDFQAATDAEELTILEADAGTVDFRELKNLDKKAGPQSALKVVGNLPYAITGQVMRNIIDQSEALDRVVVMVQKEVRDRWLSPPGSREYSAATVFLSAVFVPSSVCIVRRGAFHPAPKVDSAVVAFRKREDGGHRVDGWFEAIVRSAFQQRRKMLRNSMSSAFPEETMGNVDIEAILLSQEIDPMKRAENLSADEFARVAKHCETLFGPKIKSLETIE